MVQLAVWPPLNMNKQCDINRTCQSSNQYIHLEPGVQKEKQIDTINPQQQTYKDDTTNN